MDIEEVFTNLKSNSRESWEETVRIVVKVADNILKYPNDSKVRILKKSNSIIQNKVLAVQGGRQCLLLMGFRENSSCFELPSNCSLEKLEEIRTTLLSLKDTDVSPVKTEGTFRKKEEQLKIDGDDLQEVKRFILPPFSPKSTNPFLRQVETHFHMALAYDDKECQKRAKKLIPLQKLETNAQERLRFIQNKIRKENFPDPEVSIQDLLLLELLAWFKEDFFSWVDIPNCDKCNTKTVLSHMSTDPEDLHYTKRVEVYKCERCKHLTKFPRYNDLNILLETRRGRCGEWAQVFTLMCRSLDWDARYIVDELDHVWTEVYSMAQNRWIHCDPCENACDTPLMYESGWNKKLSYVIAYSPDEVQDVTWRYSSNHKEVLTRRKNCSEDSLIETLFKLREERHESFSKIKLEYLKRRLIRELIELMVEKQPQDNEKFGRISGSEEWRIARGESKNENMFVWTIEDDHIVGDRLIIRYSAALDRYEMVKGDNRVLKVDDWKCGVYEYSNIFRKEEKDWKTVYLARNEGTDEGTIVWKFELAQNVTKTIDSISVNFSHKMYENGIVNMKVESGNNCLDLPIDNESLETSAFSGSRAFSISCTLRGGKGNVAWQHAQLFRQSFEDTDYPFNIDISFKQ